MVDKVLVAKDKRYYEKPLKKTINVITVSILKLISYLPFWIIYSISDLLYLLLRYIIKYRYKVIVENLKNAFPDKTKQEIKTIIKKFYRHFCDLTLESVKLYSMKSKQMEKRLSFEGLDPVHKCFEKGKSILVLAFHHNNWEWCSYAQQKVKHLVLMVYNPIRGNRYMEQFLLNSREKWGGNCIPVHKSARSLIEFNRLGIPNVLWLAADQTPPASSKFWTIFMNREAPFFSGPEKIAVKTNQPVYFQHVKKIKRGRYKVIISLLFEEPAKVDPNQILLAYIKKMEDIIRKEPEYYLWSHRRWKHTRPDNISLTL